MYNKQAEDMKKRLKEVEVARERDFLKMYNDHQHRQEQQSSFLHHQKKAKHIYTLEERASRLMVRVSIC